MNKLKLTSISGNSESAGNGGDPTADRILYQMGFRPMDFRTHTTGDRLEYGMYMGAYPQNGSEFFVYYDGPLGDVKGSGNFRLVRVDGDKEIELDSGTMSLGHYNRGTMPTYYGEGTMLPSYSFHISFTEEEAQQNAVAQAN